MQLVPVRSDDFGGEWILDIPAECPAGASSSELLASPHAPSPPNARPAAAAAASASPNAGHSPLRAHAKAFSLPAGASSQSDRGITTLTKKQAVPVWKAWVRQPENGHHAIAIPAGASKNGKPRARFERIRGCRTIGEYMAQWRKLGDKDKY